MSRSEHAVVDDAGKDKGIEKKKKKKGAQDEASEYALVAADAAATEKDLWATGIVNEEYLKALNALFGNFLRLRASEPTTLSILHLETSLSEETQEAVLDVLFFSKASLCLSGTLTMIIKRGNNMKQSVRNPSAYCKLTLGNTPSRQTKVVTTGPNPEWDENFVYSFESPPKGQKLHISCKNKSKMRKVEFCKSDMKVQRSHNFRIFKLALPASKRPKQQDVPKRARLRESIRQK
nr:hypothetical protein [Tanacetum cinerariifolium]